jgi:hypothetical protein
MAEKKLDKCAHAGCECAVPKGSKYCSFYCESMFNQPYGTCKCTHAECVTKEKAKAAGVS